MLTIPIPAPLQIPLLGPRYTQSTVKRSRASPSFVPSVPRRNFCAICFAAQTPYVIFPQNTVLMTEAALSFRTRTRTIGCGVVSPTC